MSAFAKMTKMLSARKGVHDPKALAAYIGRKKYGAKGMAEKAAAGRHHG
jgi:hypothetical protein